MKFQPHPTISSLLVLASIVALAGALSPAAAQTRRWNRQEDFVLFTGDQVPTLLGAEVRDLHLYTCGRAGFRAIPFQVDKRDQEGRYVFPNEKIRDPLRDGTRLDANDELVFMAKDGGEACPEPVWAEAATRGVAMELRDPLDDGRAWVYLFDQPGAEPPQTEDYARHRIENNKELISSDQYEIGQQLGVTYYDWLRIRKPDGSFSPDLLNRTKVGLRARLLNVGIPINVPEKDMKSLTLGVIDGPVRVIRDEVDLVKIKALGLDWETEAFYTYYGNGHISPMEANVPVNLHKLFLDINFYWAMDLNESLLGAIFRNQANPRGVTLDGNHHANLDTKSDTSYLTVSGPQGGMVDALVLDQTLSQLLVRTTLVREELANPDSPDEHPGQLLVGYWVKSSSHMPKGVYHWQLYHYYPYPFSEGKVQEVLNMVEKPLQLSIRPLASPELAP